MPDLKQGLKKIKVSKPRAGFDLPVGSESDLPPFPPHFRVNENQIPEIKGWKPGEHYFMVVELRQTEKEDRENEPVRASFDIVAYKHLPEKKLEELTDEEFEIEQGKALAGKG